MVNTLNFYILSILLRQPMLSPSILSTASSDTVTPFRDISRIAPAPPTAQLQTTESLPPDRATRRRARLRKFAFAEGTALLALGGSVWAGLSDRFAEVSLNQFFEVWTIASAAAVAVIPIILFGMPQRDRRSRRLRRF